MGEPEPQLIKGIQELFGVEYPDLSKYVGQYVKLHCIDKEGKKRAPTGFVHLVNGEPSVEVPCIPRRLLYIEPEKKRAYVSAVIPAGTKRVLEFFARKEGVSLSKLIERILREWAATKYGELVEKRRQEKMREWEEKLWRNLMELLREGENK